MKRFAAITLLLVLTLALIACDNDRVSQEEYDRVLEEYNRLTENDNNSNDTQASTPTPEATLSDNSTDLGASQSTAPTSPFGNHEGDDEYFFPTTDDYIEQFFTTDIHYDWISDNDTFSVTFYNLASYDNEGNLVGYSHKCVLTNENDAAHLAGLFGNQHTQVGNVLYLVWKEGETTDWPLGEWLKKSDTIETLISAGNEYYVSKP